MKDVADKPDSILRELGQHVVIADNRVRHDTKGELPLRQPEPRNRVLGPESRKFHQRLVNRRRGSARRRRRRLLLIVLHVEKNSGSPLLRQVNHPKVKLRLIYFWLTV